MDKRLQPGGARFSDHLPQDLGLKVRSRGLDLIVAVSGDLDVHSAPQLREELAAQARRGHDRIVVDLREVTFLDSAGMGVLVGARNRLDAVNGDLTIVCGNQRVLRLFELTGLDQALPILEAVAALD